MPSPRLVPQVLGLVAGVSPLLGARSSRQWALWLARVWDPGSPLLAAIRKRTPAYLIGISTPAPLGPPLRSAQIRDERDRLVADLGNIQPARRATPVAARNSSRPADASRLALTSCRC